ncbi:MAG: hypothetical protein K2Q23_09780 [Bryobacteraceae bacterium]|nr:hypothetical protein [Bryobacteraceae bacterium]
MNALLKKLNYAGQKVVAVVGEAEAFGDASAEFGVEVKNSLARTKGIEWVIGFVTKLAEVERFADHVAKATTGDAVVWIAYPKGTSKKYRCEFNRDTGWAAMGAQGFEPVRQVAIDEDWTALRFRRVEFIAKMTRSFAMTQAGQAKAKKKR